MSLVSPKDIAKVLHLDKLGFIGTAVGWLFIKITRISGINRVYDNVKHLKGQDFFKALLKELKLRYEVSDEDLRRIPKDGAFISISNHPLGGVDGIILLKLLTELRPDFKITANFLLNNIKPIAPYLIAVNPFENRKDIKQYVGASKLVLQHLSEGKPIGFFPAGEVSTVKKGNIYEDIAWNKGVIRIIQRAKVPVIPIYFHTKNSRLFYFLSNISGLLRTLKLPSEVLNKDRKPVKIRIGKPIFVKEQEGFENNDELCQFLRQKTYMLSNAYNPNKGKLKNAVKEKLKVKGNPQAIVEEQAYSAIEKEIVQLRKSDKRLLAVKNYEVFFAESADIPVILQEIGRLREITFREVGEGTNKSIDLDAFDSYYHHKFLWDNEAKKIVGAYRMGLGNEIYKQYGVKGFYINTLFKFEPEVEKMLADSIEMGRAFVISEYQLKPMPLFLLWKGIIHVTLRYPQYKYLIGGVSISNKFSSFSKSLMIEFMKSNYYDLMVAQYIRPKNEYKVKLKDEDKDFIFERTKADLKKFDNFISEIEPEGLRMPVLIKKYIKQNARLIGFNVDPKFNNAIDGLMYIRIDDLPESTVKPVMEDYLAQLLKKEKKRKK